MHKFMAMQIPAIIDFEASGFGRSSYPIEVGIVTESGESWCSLIKPEVDWQHWDQEAERAHHISRDILLQHGKSCAFVADQLNHILHGQVIYSDGWMYDYIWMARLYDAANIVPRFQLEDLRRVLSIGQQDRWHVTKSAIQEELRANRHRASSDARILQLTWLRTSIDAEDLPSQPRDESLANTPHGVTPLARH